jgi:DNA processing protein
MKYVNASVMSEYDEFLDLLSITKLTENKLYSLLEHFKTPQRIKNAPAASLVQLVGKDVAHSILTLHKDDSLRRQYDIVEKLGITILPYYSSAYPRWLKQTEHFPPILFVRGSILADDETAVAVIGTRGATVYGKGIAESFAAEFAQAHVTVVSGMARGVDTAAHRGALKNNGRTIAVLGCGIDRCYPPENKGLMADIIQHGAVVSEFTIGTPPRAQNFPKRNRIISALSKAVVAIEAKEKSGVMNTISWALQQNKDVYAIPGNIYSKTSQGTNRLIKEGAIPVTSAAEVLESLGIRYATIERAAKEVIMTEAEKLVWDALSHEPMYLDTLSEHLNCPTSSILNTLLGLEIKGLVKQLPGMMFVKNLK